MVSVSGKRHNTIPAPVSSSVFTVFRQVRFRLTCPKSVIAPSNIDFFWRIDLIHPCG